jgi:polysaccharide biosynthesis protein PslJ
MRVIPGDAQGAPIAATTAILGALLALSLTIISGRPATVVALVLVITAIITSARSALLRWRTLFLLLLFAVLFIPIGRYRLPGSLPFELEPYRLLVAFILLIWFGALLIDPRVKFRRSGFEAPLILIGIATLGSIVANGDRIASLNVSSDVVKTASFELSFFLVFYFVVSTVRWPRDVNTAVKVLVGGGVIVSVLAVIESRTGFNPFAQLSFIPGFEPRSDLATTLPQDAARYGKIRAFGPAQHPIALGALLAILIPLAVYLGLATRRRIWWLAALVLAVGANAAVSRTPMVMLAVSVLAVVLLRPREAVRYWPALIPALVVVHFALPGTLGSIRAQFFPKGGLIAEQEVHPGSESSAGRVADLSPSLHEAAQKPLFGDGIGTRITTGPRANARLLDDQWLGTLLETGVLGLVGWIWMIWRFLRRAGREAKYDDSERGWLLGALVASVAGFGAGMFFYDAFAFIQVTFVFFFLLGLGAVVLAQGAAAGGTPRPS